jgi:hypothetical protein
MFRTTGDAFNAAISTHLAAEPAFALAGHG